jgi:hypothetical protein
LPVGETVEAPRRTATATAGWGAWDRVRLGLGRPGAYIPLLARRPFGGRGGGLGQAGL